MALVSFLQNRKLILSTRIAQLSIAVAFFVLLCWVSTHRGPWNALNGTIAIGAIVSIFTFFVTAHGIWISNPMRSNPFPVHGKVYIWGRLLVEIVMILFWAGALAVLLQHKSSEEFNDDILNSPPYATWLICAILAVPETVLFVLSLVMIIADDHLSSSAWSKTNVSHA